MKTVIRNKEGEITHTYLTTINGIKVYLTKEAKREYNNPVTKKDLKLFFGGDSKKILRESMRDIINVEQTLLEVKLTIKLVCGHIQEKDIIRE